MQSEHALVVIVLSIRISFRFTVGLPNAYLYFFPFDLSFASLPFIGLPACLPCLSFRTQRGKRIGIGIGIGIGVRTLGLGRNGMVLTRETDGWEDIEPN